LRERHDERFIFDKEYQGRRHPVQIRAVFPYPPHQRFRGRR